MVTYENDDALRAALDKVNGHTMKHLAQISDIISVIARVDALLEAAHLPASYQPGTEVSWRAGGANADIHGYLMIRTRLKLLRGKRGWYLTGAERVSVHPGASEQLIVAISRAQRDYIVAAALKPFQVRDGNEAVTNQELD